MRRIRTLAVGVALVALVATGCEWHLQTLDGNGGLPGSTTDSVGGEQSAISYNGRPHVFYYDLTAHSLRHAYHTGSFWAFEALDGPASTRPGHTVHNVGSDTSAIIYNGRPHTFYRDKDDQSLRHAYWNGIAWAFETLDGTGSVVPGHTTDDVGEYTAAMLYNGRPHIFYYGRATGSLRHAYWNGVAWAFETLDGTGSVVPGHTMNDVGQQSSVVLYNGRPHIFYYDTADLTLRHAYWNGIAWAFETLDGAGSARPGHTNNDVGAFSAAVLYKARPHVFYFDFTTRALRHAYWNGIAWAFEVLDGTGSGVSGHTTRDVGRETAAILYGGRPDVYYGDFDDKSMRRAYWNGSEWIFTVIDGTGSSIQGHTTGYANLGSAPVIVAGQLRVFYPIIDSLAPPDAALREARFF